jgi:hypothetical protein
MRGKKVKRNKILEEAVKPLFYLRGVWDDVGTVVSTI